LHERLVDSAVDQEPAGVDARMFGRKMLVRCDSETFQFALHERQVGRVYVNRARRFGCEILDRRAARACHEIGAHRILFEQPRDDREREIDAKRFSLANQRIALTGQLV
jgi:hypothetical protein